MICTKEATDEEGYKTTENVEVIYNSNKVLEVTSTNISETNSNYIDIALGFSNVFITAFNNIEGIKATVEKIGNNKIKTEMKIEYEKLDVEKIKNNFSLTNDNEGLYSSVNYTIDQFKEKNLNGYSCQ